MQCEEKLGNKAKIIKTTCKKTFHEYNEIKFMKFREMYVIRFTLLKAVVCMRRSSAPTMKDVAREAGVALGTVSKVFNNGSVGEEYRRRVMEAAQRLGYQVTATPGG